MYIIEVGFSGTESLWRINFPRFMNVSNSISENNSTDDVIAYPNPANGNLNFSFKNGLNKKYDLRVYDGYSRIIFSKNEIKSDERFTLNTSAFDQGIYFWKFSGEQLKSTGHFVVLH